MRRSATVGAWTRREAMLVSALAAGAALAALAAPLGIASLQIAGAVVAAVGAIARIVIAVRRAGLEAEVERAAFEGLVRVGVGPIGGIDPTLIGIDRAEQTILPGGAVPSYEPRSADDEIRRAVACALDGSGPWIVIVNGPSKVGKSRSLYEALLECARTTPLDLVAPVDTPALKALLEPGVGLPDGSAAAVLWLDDLEPFLNAGTTWQTLRAWRSLAPSRIVAATYGGRGSDQIAGSPTRGLASIAADIQGRAREVTLRATSASEIAALRVRLNAEDADALERHGLAAYLVAGPTLERKLSTARHGPGDDACPHGAALVDAAVDWARCGRTDAVSREAFRQMWPSYVPLGSVTNDDVFQEALDWALKPVAGTIALLQRADGYKPFDYVVRLERDRAGARPIRDEAWSAVVAAAPAEQLLTVATCAYDHGRNDVALEAFALARASSVDGISATAGFNLAVVLGELNRREDAIAAYRDVIDRFGGSAEPTPRAVVIRTLFNTGVALDALGRFEEAVSRYDEAGARASDDDRPASEALAACALVNKGVALCELEREAEAIVAYDDVIARFGGMGASELREQTAKALVNKGVALGRLERSEDAIVTYDDVLARFGGAAELALREHVAKALINKGLRLEAVRRSNEALAVRREVVARFGGADEPSLRGYAATALFDAAVALEGRGRTEEAIAAFDEIAALLDDADDPGLRCQAASALANKALALASLGRSDEAARISDQIAADFDDVVDVGGAKHG